MGGGLESSCVGCVYSAGGAVEDAGSNNPQVSTNM